MDDGTPLERFSLVPCLDETDLEILELLVDDARRPLRDIADAVGLSPPTVSDRVDRLRGLGLIRGFTIDIDQSMLTGGTPVVIDLDLAIDAADLLAETVDLDAIRSYEVRRLTDSAWRPQVGLSGFDLTCDECGNAVTSEGERTRIDGERYQFCCENRLVAFRERYETFSRSV